ncbi:MAG: hypothetical protein Q9207_007354 [Kuettlingeria erythrocarpa]
MDDRARLPSLFSDFTTQRQTNPNGYAANVKTWEDVLYKATRAGLITAQDGHICRLSLETGPHLLQELESKEWGRPLALNAVIEACFRLVTYLRRRRSQVDRILTREMFRRESASTLSVTNELSDSDVAVLLKYLARDRRILAYDDHVVRLAASEDVPLPISKEDREIASLKSLMYDINEQIASLETRITALREQSQKAVSQKNRSSALAALRSKKVAETALAQRHDTLIHLEEIYGKIEQASDNITMVQAMKGSTSVLRGLNARVGSTQDVEDALNNLKEEMGKVEDVGTIMTQVGQETNAVNEDEVDEELDALVRERNEGDEEKAAEETTRRLANFHAPVDVKQVLAHGLTMVDHGERTTALVASEPQVDGETRFLERMSLDENSTKSPDAVRDSHNQKGNAALVLS